MLLGWMGGLLLSLYVFCADGFSELSNALPEPTLSAAKTNQLFELIGLQAPVDDSPEAQRALQFLIHALENSPKLKRSQSLQSLLSPKPAAELDLQTLHPAFRLAPELYAPLLWSLQHLVPAAHSTEHPITVEELEVQLSLLVRQFTEGQRSSKASLRSHKLGYLYEFVAAAHFVSQDYRLVGLQRILFLDQHTGIELEVDILLQEPNQQESFILVEVKSNVTGLVGLEPGSAELSNHQYKRMESKILGQLWTADHLPTNSEAIEDPQFQFRDPAQEPISLKSFDREFSTEVRRISSGIIISANPVLEANRKVFAQLFPELVLMELPEELQPSSLIPALND